MSTDTRYAYAVSRIRALEPALLDRGTVERLLGETPEGLLRWAREGQYAAAFADVDAVHEFPRGLHRDVTATQDMLDSIAPEPELMRVFRLRYDYHNLKLLFKAQALERPVPDASSNLGTIPYDRLEEIVREEEWIWLPEMMRDTWRKAERALDEQQSLRVITALFANARYAHSRAVAAEYGDELLVRIFRQIITVHNIQTFLRIKDGAAPREEFDHLFIAGGAWDQAFYRGHFDQPVQLFLESLGRTEFARHMLVQGIEALPDARDYWRLDVARDNYFLYFLGQTRAECFNIGPLVNYLFRKKADAKALSTLWMGGRAGWDRAKIRQRLRSVYA